MNPENKPLIIGIGNRDRGDDQVGIRVAEYIQQRMGATVDVLMHRGDPAYLIEQWQDRQLVIAIDAVVSEDMPEGEIFCWDAGKQTLALESCRTSTHNLGINEAIELARALHRLPQRFYVYGINARAFRPGQGMSTFVCASAQKLSNEIIQRLKGKTDSLAMD